ncbi:AMP-binding protein (plasmid) [Rhodococcus globerulus]|uniref:AMP-binding protein n=1 Tax=Rhodococcus globerulus TaxID=33008 RepID=UPI0039E88F1A
MRGPCARLRSSFGDADVDIIRLPGDVIEVRSRTTPSAAPTSTLNWLQHWATVTPSTPFLSEVVDGIRVSVDYATAWDAVVRTAFALLGSGVGRGDRVVVVAHNGVDSFVVGHAAMLAGAVWVPIAPQYLGLGADRTKIAQVLEKISPALIFVPDDTLRARVPQGYDVVGQIATDGSAFEGNTLLGHLTGGDRAKLLLTSGSTGLPKAVVYTHRMLVSNVRATAGCLDVRHRSSTCSRRLVTLESRIRR